MHKETRFGKLLIKDFTELFNSLGFLAIIFSVGLGIRTIVPTGSWERFVAYWAGKILVWPPLIILILLPAISAIGSYGKVRQFNKQTGNIPILRKFILWLKINSRNLFNAKFSKKILEVAELVRVNDTDPVYLVIGNSIYHIPDRETFEAFGYDWDSVITLNERFFNKYREESAIESVKSARMVQVGGDRAVYLILSNKKRVIPDPETLLAMHRKWEEIEIIPQKELDSYSTGKPLSSVASWSLVTRKMLAGFGNDN